VSKITRLAFVAVFTNPLDRHVGGELAGLAVFSHVAVPEVVCSAHLLIHDTGGHNEDSPCVDIFLVEEPNEDNEVGALGALEQRLPTWRCTPLHRIASCATRLNRNADIAFVFHGDDVDCGRVHHPTRIHVASNPAAQQEGCLHNKFAR